MPERPMRRRRPPRGRPTAYTEGPWSREATRYPDALSDLMPHATVRLPRGVEEWFKPEYERLMVPVWAFKCVYERETGESADGGPVGEPRSSAEGDLGKLVWIDFWQRFLGRAACGFRRRRRQD